MTPPATVRGRIGRSGARRVGWCTRRSTRPDRSSIDYHFPSVTQPLRPNFGPKLPVCPFSRFTKLFFFRLILSLFFSLSAYVPDRKNLKLGMQSGVLVGAAPYALPLKHKLLPEYLSEDLGYVPHAVGKWHLGSHRAVYTPTERGFRSHIGYWTGHEDYYDHTAQELYKPVVRRLFCWKWRWP